MSDHAIFSPSSSGIWLNCPASLRLSEGLPDTTNEASERGTRIHKTAEALLLGTEVEHPEHVDDAQPYVDFVQRETHPAMHWHRMIERRVHLTAECFGTADILAVRGIHDAKVIDLKTGRIPVSAKDNPQLAIYAAAAAKEFGVRQVHTIIWQNGQTSTDVLAGPDFEKITNRVLNAQAQVDTAKPFPGEHCTWCKARAVCRERALHVLNVAGSDRTTDDDLSVLLTHARQAADWAADIEERAQKVMSLGGRIDGFKLVEGTTRRKWREDAVATLKELGLDDLFEESLIPIGQAEKLLGRDRKGLIAPAVEKPVGKPTIVSNDDPRQTIQPQVNLKDFT
jgi:hypothetical protein